MAQKYYKNQILVIFIVILGLLFTVKQFIEYNNTLNENDTFTKKIIKQNCHAAPRMKSTVWISFNKKIYSIGIPYQECADYTIGKNIKVLYNNDQDKFIYRVKSPKYLNNIVLLLIFLLISLIPWRYINKNYLRFKY